VAAHKAQEAAADRAEEAKVVQQDEERQERAARATTARQARRADAAKKAARMGSSEEQILAEAERRLARCTVALAKRDDAIRSLKEQMETLVPQRAALGASRSLPALHGPKKRARASEASSFIAAMARLRAALLECAECEADREAEGKVDHEVDREPDRILPPLSHAHSHTAARAHPRYRQGARGEEVHRQRQEPDGMTAELELREWRQPTPLHHRLIPGSRQRHRAQERGVEAPDEKGNANGSTWAWADPKPVRRVYSSLPLGMRSR